MRFWNWFGLVSFGVSVTLGGRFVNNNYVVVIDTNDGLWTKLSSLVMFVASVGGCAMIPHVKIVVGF